MSLLPRKMLLVVAFTGLLAACGGGTTTPLVENVDQLIEATETGDFNALVAEGNTAWENRSDKASVESAIAAWEQATRVPTPDDVSRRDALFPVYVSLSKGYYWLAHGHLRWEADSTEAMMATYEQGMHYAETALALNNDAWTNALLYGTPIPDAVSTLTEADVPAAYWYATNLGRWGLLRGIATVLANVSDIKAMMDRVEALNAEYFYGAPDRYFGVYYTKLPFGNPDLDQSQRRLRSCIERYPSYLETRVLLAEEWAVVMQDRATFEEQLNAVVSTDIQQWPELLPENSNAFRRAQYLLENADEFFR
jgi:hypothetical protein